MQQILTLVTHRCQSFAGILSKTVAGLVVAIGAIAFIPNSSASQINPETEIPSYEEIVIPTSFVIHIDNNAVIRDVATGVVMTTDDVQAKILPGIVVGIIIGAGSGAISAAVGGGNWGQIAAAGLIGGVGGYYGGIAAITTGISRVLYGTYSVAYGGGVASLVGSSQNNSGCGPQANTCVIRTR